MSDTEDWVDVSDYEPTTSLATVDPDAYESKPNTNLATMDLAAYNAFVSDTANPAPVFKAADLCYVLRYPNSFGAEAKAVVKAHAHCNVCLSRAGVYCRDLGPEGPAFFHHLNARTMSPCIEVDQLRALAIKTCAQEVAKPELVVVTSSTYAPAQEGCAPCGTPFFHWTVAPAEVTEPSVAARFERLRAYYGQMDTRLAKLTVPEAVASVAIMVEEQAALERPSHYEAVLRWVVHVQTRCLFGVPFEEMGPADQARLRVVAIMLGRAEGATHLDFHQAENIVDFLSMPSRDALRAEMDRRSDPQFYMVSQLNRRLAAEGVTSNHLIGLTWKDRDDLDLHVTTPSGSVIYYGNKAADGCRLDFDANVDKGEANPCENVSCKPGTFTVRVNNYTRRTFGAPVPFQVVCRQAGVVDVVHDGVWGINRKKGDMITFTHTFTEAGEAREAPAMSTSAAARAKALDAEWAAKVGDPTATVATLDSLTGKHGVSVVVCGSGSAVPATAAEPASVGRAFMQMAVASTNSAAAAAKAQLEAAKASKTKGGKTKAYLSQQVKALPGTVADLVAHLAANPHASLSIHMRDHSPGYLVDIGTKTEGVRKTDLPSSCHYHDKHAHPVKPVAGTIGNARLDASWLGHNVDALDGSRSRSRRVEVKAIVDVAASCPFLALHGAKLPPPTGSAPPLASGFYPTDLAASFHAHRERWTFYNTQLAPRMPSSRSLPMVGTFLTGHVSVVYLDGVRLKIKAR